MAAFEDQERSLLQKIGLGFSAFGAGVGGRGQQFAQEQQRLSKGRKTALAQDALAARNLLQSGDLQGTSDFFEDRIQEINRLRGDPSETIELRNKITSGDPNDLRSAMLELNAVVSVAQDRGILERAAPPEEFTLSPGQRRFRGGEEIARAPERPIDEEDRALKREAQRLRAEESKLRALELQSRRETNAIKKRELKNQIERKSREREFVAKGAIANIDNSINTIDTLLAGEGLEKAAGISANFPTLAGTEAAAFEATLDTLQSQAFLSQVEKMKGLGALSEAEGKKLSAALGTLSINLPDKKLRTELNRIQATMQVARERMKKKFGIEPDQPQAGGIKFLGFE